MPFRRTMLPSVPILARPLRRRAGPSRLSGLPNSSPGLPPSDLPVPSPPPGSASPPGPASDPKILGKKPFLAAVPIPSSACRDHFLAKAPASSLGPVRYLLLGHVLASQSGPIGHRPSVRGPSWDFPLSRCPDLLLRACPACGGETKISSGASCRLRSEDPPNRSGQASWGSPTLTKRIPLHRLAGGDRKFRPALAVHPCGPLEGPGRCPPITCSR